MSDKYIDAEDAEIISEINTETLSVSDKIDIQSSELDLKVVDVDISNEDMTRPGPNFSKDQLREMIASANNKKQDPKIQEMIKKHEDAEREKKQKAEEKLAPKLKKRRAKNKVARTSRKTNRS